MHKLFYQKTWLNKNMLRERQVLKSDRCLASTDTNAIAISDSHIALVGAETFSFLGFFFLEALQWRIKIFYLDKDTYEFNLVLYYKYDSR